MCIRDRTRGTTCKQIAGGVIDGVGTNRYITILVRAKNKKVIGHNRRVCRISGNDVDSEVSVPNSAVVFHFLHTANLLSASVIIINDRPPLPIYSHTSYLFSPPSFFVPAHHLLSYLSARCVYIAYLPKLYHPIRT